MTLPSELIDQVAAFHEDAFSWAAACCGGDMESGADTLQDCYIKVMTRRATFAGRSSLKTWWFAVIRLTALEQRRRQQRWRRMADAFRRWVESSADQLPETPVNALALPPTGDQLAVALGRLPPRQAEILHLVFQHELSVNESATVMNISVGSARQHYERAKKRLRKELATLSPAHVSEHAT